MSAATENKLANPGPLGLMGFGMTTVLLNLHNAGFFPNTSVVLAMGVFFGILAGGGSAMYLSLAEILHEQHGRKVLPY